MEYIHGIHLFTRTHKLDRFGDNGADRQGCTTAGITVKLCEHNSVEIETIVELLGSVYGILTSHRVNHEESLIGIDSLLEVGNLVHHLLVNSETSGGIDDNHIVALGLGLTYGIVGNLHNILVVRLCINGNTYGFSYNLQLFDSGRTIHVASHEQRLFVVLVFQHVGKFATEGCLTRTLQS